jgi:hypothetical protein
MEWGYRSRYELNRAFGIPNHPPCANCGKIDGGFMGSSRWGHDYKCCSDRCGMRLKKRIENGMYPPSEPIINWQNPFPSREREQRLRYRIKHLEKQLILLGYKPTGTPKEDE